MYVVVSTYLKTKDDVAPLLEAQALWLRQHHEEGHFVLSGSVLPRQGSVILVQGMTREELEILMQQSPLACAQAVDYEIRDIAPDFFWE